MEPHTVRGTLAVLADLPTYLLDLLVLSRVLVLVLVHVHGRPEQPEPGHGQQPEPALAPVPEHAELVHAGCTLVGHTAEYELAGALCEGPVAAVAVAAVVAVAVARGHCEDEDS